MRTIFLTISLLISTGPLFSQQLSNDSLIGTWKVVSSQLLSYSEMGLDAEGKKKMEEASKGFIGTKFGFSNNAKFTIEFPSTIPVFMKAFEFLSNRSWNIKGKDLIQIGTDKEHLMRILVRYKENKIFFLLDETPFILEVIKL